MRAFPSTVVLVSGTVATATLVVVCVHWVDAPLALFMHAHPPSAPLHAWLAAFTHLVDVLVLASVLVLLAAPARLASCRPLTPGERTALTMALSLAVAAFLKEWLKYVFGRAWPDTWIDHNPSLIHDHVYGFFWLQRGPGFHAFPSGHTTLTFAALVPAWRNHPRARLPVAAACLLVVTGLLWLDYHFLGDIAAGAALGSACGLYLGAAMRLRLRA